MLFDKLFHRRSCPVSARRHSDEAVRRAARAVVLMEPLGKRVLLSSSYNVPTTSGGNAVTDVYLKPSTDLTLYDVDVKLNSPTASTVITLTPDATTHLISIHGQRSGLVLHDMVVAAVKPTGGISFDNSSNGVLEVNPGADDQTINVPDDNTITAYDGSSTGIDTRGAGVSYMRIVVNDAGGATVNATADNLDLTNVLRIETGSGTDDTINIGGGENSSATGVIIHTGAGGDVVNLGQDGDGDGSTTATVDFDPGLGNTLGLGNELNIGTSFFTTAIHCTATLAKTPGSSNDTIELDNVHVASGGTLVVSDWSFIGELNVNAGATASVEGSLHIGGSDEVTGIFNLAGTATLTAGSASMYGSDDWIMNLSGTLNMNLGSHFEVVYLNVDSGGTVNAAAGADLSIYTADVSGTLNLNLTSTTSVYVTILNASGTVNVNDGGLFTVYTVDASGTVNVDAATVSILHTSTIGTLNITNGGRVTLAARSTRSGASLHAKLAVLYLDNLNISMLSLVATSVLDMNDNDLIVNNGDFDTIFDLWVGGWSATPDSGKTGIISTTGQNSGDTIMLMFSNASFAAENGNPVPDWEGTTVGSSAIIGKYTYIGDTNADGMVTGDDYGAIEANLYRSALDHGLAQLLGDTNYDYEITGDDYGAIEAHLGLGENDPL